MRRSDRLRRALLAPRAAFSLAALGATAAYVGHAQRATTPPAAFESDAPEVYPRALLDAPAVPPAEGVVPIAVPAEVREPAARTVVRDPVLARHVRLATPAAAMPPPPGNPPSRGAVAPPPSPDLVLSFPGPVFEDNFSVNDGQISPRADPHLAVGPGHLVSTINTILELRHKDGTLATPPIALADFFAPLAPLTVTFDPRVAWDPHAGRWLVLTDERTIEAFGDPADTARIFLAVSDDANPLGTWYQTAIDAKTTIAGLPRWCDYPTLGVTPDGVYVTCDMLSFEIAGRLGGERLWAVAKGVGQGGFYDGGTASVVKLDPFAEAGVASTTQPASLLGAGPPGGGTWLVTLSGISGGATSYVQVTRLRDPFGAQPVFELEVVDSGVIDDLEVSVPDAPQLGDGPPLDAGDRRALAAVAQGTDLWVTGTIVPVGAADPDRGQATTHWWQLRTAPAGGATTLVQQGNAGGEDIAPGTYTFFSSLAARADGSVAVVFSASGPAVHPGAFYARRRPSDAPGTLRPTATLAAGLGAFVRNFGDPARNGWGDYAGAGVDPIDDCFWLYDQRAIEPGFVLPSYPEQDGRWGTVYGRVCDEAEPATRVFEDGFEEGTTQRWTGSFGTP